MVFKLETLCIMIKLTDNFNMDRVGESVCNSHDNVLGWN